MDKNNYRYCTVKQSRDKNGAEGEVTYKETCCSDVYIVPLCDISDYKNQIKEVKLSCEDELVQ